MSAVKENQGAWPKNVDDEDAPVAGVVAGYSPRKFAYLIRENKTINEEYETSNDVREISERSAFRGS